MPAAIDSWTTALKEFGTLTFAEVAAPAIEMAENGFEAYDFFCANIEADAARLCQWPSNAEIFFPAAGRLVPAPASCSVTRRGRFACWSRRRKVPGIEVVKRASRRLVTAFIRVTSPSEMAGFLCRAGRVPDARGPRAIPRRYRGAGDRPAIAVTTSTVVDPGARDRSRHRRWRFWTAMIWRPPATTLPGLCI